ncbi:predicted protein [Botrytis cinerea T4]|uniref:Uncharacterized protein n=1 Tax=Botryotinia fuckeliana (strain T4) TaxID=999810 RepID=G2YTY4_BOTF4|nr:predicted protein [Botrytis cinerea T4]
MVPALVRNKEELRKVITKLPILELQQLRIVKICSSNRPERVTNKIMHLACYFHT